MKEFSIITCPQWGAKPPKAPPIMVPKSVRTILHHTAGHHPEIENPQDESLEEAMRYARDIQHFHMFDRDHLWNDSGHNFLVCRNGAILQGRWITVNAIEAQHMVVSAHCPHQNDQIGIEHEHVSGEKPTKVQLQASGWLNAWIAQQYGRNTAMPIQPHKMYFNTSCPDNLLAYKSTIYQIATQYMEV